MIPKLLLLSVLVVATIPGGGSQSLNMDFKQCETWEAKAAHLARDDNARRVTEYLGSTVVQVEFPYLADHPKAYSTALIIAEIRGRCCTQFIGHVMSFPWFRECGADNDDPTKFVDLLNRSHKRIRYSIRLTERDETVLPAFDKTYKRCITDMLPIVDGTSK